MTPEFTIQGFKRHVTIRRPFDLQIHAATFTDPALAADHLLSLTTSYEEATAARPDWTYYWTLRHNGRRWSMREGY